MTTTFTAVLPAHHIPDAPDVLSDGLELMMTAYEDGTRTLAVRPNRADSRWSPPVDLKRTTWAPHVDAPAGRGPLGTDPTVRVPMPRKGDDS